MKAVKAYYGEVDIMDVHTGKVLADIRVSKKDRYGNGSLAKDTCAEYVYGFSWPAIALLGMTHEQG